MTVSTNVSLALRAVEPNDIDFLFCIENDISLWDISTTTVPYSKESLRQFIYTTNNDIFADKELHLIVELTRSDGATDIVGIVDLLHFEPRHLRAEVGIVILSNYRQRGVATAVIQRVVNYAERFLHLHQLYAVIPATNQPSRQLFRHCGFRETATVADWLRTDDGYQDAIISQRILR